MEWVIQDDHVPELVKLFAAASLALVFDSDGGREYVAVKISSEAEAAQSVVQRGIRQAMFMH